MARQRVNSPKYTPEIANRFKLTRKRSGLTIHETAEKLKSNPSYVKAVEYGNISPNIDFIITWRNYFKVSYEWILEGIEK